MMTNSQEGIQKVHNDEWQQWLDRQQKELTRAGSRFIAFVKAEPYVEDEMTKDVGKEEETTTTISEEFTIVKDPEGFQKWLLKRQAEMNQAGHRFVAFVKAEPYIEHESVKARSVVLAAKNDESPNKSATQSEEFTIIKDPERLQKWLQKRQRGMSKAGNRFIAFVKAEPYEETDKNEQAMSAKVSSNAPKSKEPVLQEQEDHLQKWFQKRQKELSKAGSRFVAFVKAEPYVEEEEEEEEEEDDEESLVIIKNDKDSEEYQKFARKVGAAVVGGTLIVTGIPLIPLPGPGDFMVVGGFAVLATEFEGPRRVLDGARDKLEELLEKQNNDEQEEEKDVEKEEVEVEKKKVKKTTGIVDDAMWEEGKVHVQDATREIKRQASRVGRNVLLPMLNAVCTEKEDAEGCNASSETEESSTIKNDLAERNDLTMVSDTITLTNEAGKTQTCSDETNGTLATDTENQSTEEEEEDRLEAPPKEEEWDLCASDASLS